MDRAWPESCKLWPGPVYCVGRVGPTWARSGLPFFEPALPGGELGDWMLRLPVQPEEEEESDDAEHVDAEHGDAGHGHAEAKSGANP